MRSFRLIQILLPLVIVLVTTGYLYFDIPLATLSANINATVLSFFQMVTMLGVSTGYFIVSGILFIYYFYVSKKRIMAVQMAYVFCTVAVSGLVTNLLKWILGRWRPSVFITEGLYGFKFFGTRYEEFSFPSGHATTICAVAVALSLIWPRLRWLWLIIAVLVCLSRVLIRAHYMSDVVMGAFIGIFTAILLRNWPLFESSIKKGRYPIET